VNDLFWEFDADDSGTLDQEEFCNLTIILLSNIMGRILFQFTMTIALVPFLAPRAVAKVRAGAKRQQTQDASYRSAIASAISN